MFSTGAIPDTTDFLLLCGAMLVGMLLSLGLGRRLGRRRMLRDPEGAGQGAGTALHSFALALIVSGTFYVILDIEHPRAGLIRVDTALLADMQAPAAPWRHDRSGGSVDRA